ncbi:hypothetical protein BDQ17DRAFT_1412299 [Cyathus striatus]|nr:hypothetical protein BDQ17DRAFT_1412299 [Cyathus striatus]
MPSRKTLRAVVTKRYSASQALPDTLDDSNEPGMEKILSNTTLHQLTNGTLSQGVGNDSRLGGTGGCILWLSLLRWGDGGSGTLGGSSTSRHSGSILRMLPGKSTTAGIFALDCRLQHRMEDQSAFLHTATDVTACSALYILYSSEPAICERASQTARAEVEERRNSVREFQGDVEGVEYWSVGLELARGFWEGTRHRAPVLSFDLSHAPAQRLCKRVKDAERFGEEENVVFKAAKWRKLRGYIWWAEEQVWG